MSPLFRGLAAGVMAAQIAVAGGCAFGRKPYANDPLIKSNRAVWGSRAHAFPDSVNPEPVIPPAPKELLVGSSSAAESR